MKISLMHRIDTQGYHFKLQEGCIPESGLFLLLLHADKTPPHIGMIKDGIFHAIGMQGPERLERQVLLKTIRQKKIVTLAFMIVDSVNYLSYTTPEDALEQLQHEPFTTCLALPLACMQGIAGPETSNCRTVFDLLDILFEKNMIQGIFSEGIEHQSTFCLKQYSLKDVEARINELSLKTSTR
jgi:hypothetical protein